MRAAEIVQAGRACARGEGHSEERARSRFDTIRHSKGGQQAGTRSAANEEAMQSASRVPVDCARCQAGWIKLQELRDPLERVTVDD